MGIATFPAPSAASKTRYVVTLTSGTSWTVPAGVTYVNVALQGGGGSGGGGGGNLAQSGEKGLPGQMISSTVVTTPGSSIAYGIGAGGSGGQGGTTTFTGATSAVGGMNGAAGSSAAGQTGTQSAGWDNGGGAGTNFAGGGAGGAGKIEIEYWV